MLDNIFLIGLICLAAVLPFSIALASLVFFPLLGIWILGMKRTLGRWPPAWGPTEKAYVLFVAVSLFSSFWGMDLSHSLREIYKKDFYFLILVLIVATIKPREQVLRIVRWFLIAGLLASLFGLIQCAVGVDQTDKSGGTLLYVPQAIQHWPRPLIDHLSMINGRVRGTLDHPLKYAEMLLFVLSLALSFVGFESQRWKKWIPFIWTVGAAFLVTQSRGPWLGAVMIGALLLMACHRWTVAWRFGILALPALALLFHPSLKQRAVSIVDTDSHYSNFERLRMWRAGWQLWQEHPLTGLGPGNVKKASERFLETEREKQEGAWGHLHSTYVNFLAERGALGLLAYLFFVTVLLSELARAIRKTTHVQDLSLLWGSIASVLATLVSGFTETVYNAVIISMAFYLVTGLGLATARRVLKESADQP